MPRKKRSRSSRRLLCLLLAIGLGFACQRAGEEESRRTKAPEAAYELSGDTIPWLLDPVSHPVFKVNIRGVVKNAVEVRAEAPARMRVPAGATALSLALGVMPGIGLSPVEFEVRAGDKVIQKITVDPRSPEGWKEASFELSAGRELTVTADSPSAGAWLAAPHPWSSREKKPSVVFILVDALRQDALGIYGAKGDPSPNLDRLARQGTVFTRAYTSSAFTMTSLATIFTGLWPWQHGVLFKGETGLALPKDLPILPEEMRKAGYLTAAFSGTYFRLSKNGFLRGFDSFDETCADSFFRESADCMNRRVLAFLAAHPAEPVFLYLHYVDTHAPYYAPEPFRHRYTQGLKKPFWNDVGLGEVREFGINRPWYQFFRRPSATDVAYLRGLYQGEVAYVDSRLGTVVEKLRESYPENPPLILVTADHGEAFNEHGVMEHIRDLHEPVMRVPLILSGPGAPAGKRIEAPVRSLDYFPSLLDLARLPPPGSFSGRSILPLLQEKPEPFRPAVAMHYLGDDTEYALVEGQWKLFLTTSPDQKVVSKIVYDLIQLPLEENDLSQEKAALAQEMSKCLDDLKNIPPPLIFNDKMKHLLDNY